MSNEPTTASTAEAVSATNPTTTETAKTPAETPERSSWIKVISTSLLASLIVALVILAFTWPPKPWKRKTCPSPSPAPK